MWEYWDWTWKSDLRLKRAAAEALRGELEAAIVPPHEFSGEARLPGPGDLPVAPELSEEELRSLEASGWVARVEDILQQRTANVRFVFDAPATLSNVWACLRTMDSFGLQFAEIIQKEDEEPGRSDYMDEVLQSQPWITVRRWRDAAACVEALRQEGHTVVATDLEPGSVDMDELLPGFQEKMAGRREESGVSTCKLAVVLGNEHEGISSAMRHLADHRVFLAMQGMSQSFNLSATCAVVLSTFAARGMLVPGGLSEEVASSLRHLWLLAGAVRLRLSAKRPAALIESAR